MKNFKIPPGYTIEYGGASSESDYQGGEGWFFIPSDVPNIFYKTQIEAIEAAWKQFNDKRKA